MELKREKTGKGLSLFYTDLDRSKVEVREIDKMGRKAVDSNQLFIDGLEIPVADRIGEEGRGFEYILHGINPERVLVSADRTMATVVAPWTSTGYARDGASFERPGRATMVFSKENGAWLCTHSHMSLNRGVPQQSFANRPVKSA